MRWFLILPVLFAAPAAAQEPDSMLRGRWVGNHLERPLMLEFFGDTMLVVNDLHALDFRLSRDSLVAYGDTSFAVRYRFILGRLLLETEAGDVITASAQSNLARPLNGRWVGNVDTAGTFQVAELVLYPNRSAIWHAVPDGRNARGEWERETRALTLTWDDGAEWTGLYDPEGNTLLLEPVADSTGEVRRGVAAGIFRRAFR